MKTFKLNRLLMLLVAFLTMSINLWATSPYMGTFPSSGSVSNNSYTLNGVTWGIATTNGAGSPSITFGNAYSNTCIKFGSGASNCYGSVTLSTDYFKDNNYIVTSVSVNALGSATKDVSMTIGSSSTGAKSVANNSWTDLSIASLNVQGTLSISFSLNSAGFFIHSITITYTEGSGTTYTDYLTECCTPLDAPANVTLSSATATSVTFGWDAVTNATGYEYKVGKGDWATAAGRSATVNDLLAGQTVTVSVRATYSGSENYCATGAEVSADLTTLYTITASVNNEGYGTAEVSLDNSVWSSSVAAAPGTTIYVKAAKKTGYSFDDWSVNDGGAGEFASTSDAATTFTTGAANTTIKATFVADVKVLAGISITAVPTKVDYLEGDFFDPAGMAVTASYEDGTSTVLASGYTFTPSLTTALTPSNTIVSISYTLDGVTKTADQVITVTPVHTVTWYVNGEAVKTIERVAEGALYSALEKPVDPADNALSVCEANKFMGWAKATITKDEATESDVQFAANADAVSGTLKAFYAVFAKKQTGAAKDYTLTIDKDNAPSSYATSEASMNFFAKADDGISADLTIAVKHMNVMNYNGDVQFKKTYNNTIVGYLFNTTDLGSITSINVKNNNSLSVWKGNSSHPTTDGTGGYFTIANNTSGALSTESITINFSIGGGTEYVNYMTTCKTATGLAVKTAPKTEYNEEETLDLSGTVLTVTYDDKSTEDIMSGFTASPENGAMLANETKVTFLYKGQTCEQPITVTPLPRKTISALAPVGGSYTVKIGDGEVQTITGAQTIEEVIAGRTITMTTTAAPGYKLPSTTADRFIIKDENNESISFSKNGDNYSFTMPNQNVTIAAKYVPVYTISLAQGIVGGKISSSVTEASTGSKVTINVNPNPGYELSALYFVKSGDETRTDITLADGKYTFNMVASAITVYAEFSQINYTITLNNRGDVTTVENKHYNDVYNFEVQTTCPEYEFYGWTAAEPVEWAWETAPAKVSSYTVTESKTFYAVYRQANGTPELTDNYALIGADEFESGKNYLIVHKDGTKLFKLQNYYYDSYQEFYAHEVTAANDVIANTGYTDDYDTYTKDAFVWKITKGSGENYTICNEEDQKYINLDDIYLDYTSTSSSIAVTFADNKSVKLASTAQSNKYFYAYKDGNNAGRYYKEGDQVGANYLYKQVANTPYTYLTTPTCKTLTSLELYNDPNKMNYMEGENFDPTNMGVVARYNVGEPDILTIEDGLVIEGGENLQMSATGVTVKFTYDGHTESIVQPINMIELKSIAIKTEQTKKEYKQGATFDATGLVLNATYNTVGNTLTPIVEEVTEGFTFSPSDALMTTGEQTITINYGGKETTTTVTVVEKSPSTIKFHVYKAAYPYYTEYVATEETTGAGVKVPNVTACGNYEFVGWSKDDFYGETSCTLIDVDASGVYVPDDNETLYAVFSYLTNVSYSAITSIDALNDGDKVAVYNENGKRYMTLGTGSALSDHPATTGVSISDSYVFTLSVSDGGYAFTQGTKTVGVSSLPTSNNSNVALSNTTSNSVWKIRNVSGNLFHIYQATSVSGNQNYLEYYNGWKTYNTSNTSDQYALKNRIYVQGGTKKYTTVTECDATLDVLNVILNPGSGAVTEDAFEVFTGESVTLPTPTLADCLSDWTFAGWAKAEMKREDAAPEFVENPIAITEDAEFFAIYKRAVGNGYLYKSKPSCLQRVAITPEAGTYNEAKTLELTAGDGATIYYTLIDGESAKWVINVNYDAKTSSAVEYDPANKPVLTKAVNNIMAIAKYEDGWSDITLTKISLTMPDAPTFSLAEDAYYIGEEVTISGAEGCLLRYQVKKNGGEWSAATEVTTSGTYTFTEAGQYEIRANVQIGGLTSEIASITYTIKALPVMTGITLSGTYQTVFEKGNEFNHTGVVVSATYDTKDPEVVTDDALFSTPDMTTYGKKTVTVTYQGFEATYEINVKRPAASMLFYESFDQTNGTGGNDGKWSDNIASNTLTSDNTGWTFVQGKGADKCAKFGTGSAQGSAKTPAIAFTGTAKLTFKAAAWSGDKTDDALKLTVTSGTLSQETFTLASAEWTEYSVWITNVTDKTQITFSAVQDSKNRFFLDEVSVVKADFTRSFSSTNVSTICMPGAVAPEDRFGAQFYEIAYKVDASDYCKIYFDEVAADETLVAGKPYVIIPEAETLALIYNGAMVSSPVAGEKGLTGTFTQITDGELVGNYIFSQNKYWVVESNCTVPANRAYIQKDVINENLTPVAPVAGRRRISMGANGTNVTTDNEENIVEKELVEKHLINGVIYVIRNGRMYDLNGRLAK